MYQMMTPLIEQLFSSFGSHEKDAYKKVKQIFIEAIGNKSFPLGSVLPSPKELAACTAFSTSTFIRVYNTLTQIGLIETVNGKERTVVHVLPIIGTKKVNDVQIERCNHHGRATQFHLENGHHGSNLYVYREMGRYATLSYAECTAEKYNEWIKTITYKLVVRTNHYACANYGTDQIALADRYASALYYVCNYFLAGRDVLAVADTVSNTALQAMEGCRREICILESDEQGLITDSLEALCRKKKVGIVYVNSRGGYHTERVYSSDRIAHLMRLSKKYNFMIVEDDPHAGFHPKEANPLLKASYLIKLRMIYLSRLTFVDEHLNEVTVICGRVKEIQQLYTQLKLVGSILSPQLAYAIHNVMVNNKLYAAEKAMLDDLDQATPNVLNILQNSGLWKTGAGFHQNGWFLHLQAAMGRLPFMLKQQLANRNIHLVGTPEAIEANNVKNGIIISFAAYLTQLHMAEDFDQFHEHIKPLLK